MFEHIPSPVLKAILNEANRVLAPNGVALHHIDPSDHFSHDDAAISPINFLRFSEAQWERLTGNQFRLSQPAPRRKFRGDLSAVWPPDSAVDSQGWTGAAGRSSRRGFLWIADLRHFPGTFMHDRFACALAPHSTMSPDRPVGVLLMTQQLGAGGTERQLVEIARSLDRSRFSPHVACLIDGVRGQELRAAGVPILHLPLRTFFSPASWRQAVRMARYLHEHRIQVVHALTFRSSASEFPSRAWPERRLCSPASGRIAA